MAVGQGPRCSHKASSRVRYSVLPPMTRKLLEFVQDETGFLSATRLAFLLTISAVLGVWLMDCWHQKKMVPLDNSAVYLVLTLMAGKVGQSFAERPTTPSSPTS